MSLIVDLLAITSLVGIWPRFVEPRTLRMTELKWELEKKFHHLAGLTMIHLTDLHFHDHFPQKFLTKILQKVHAQKPDLMLFTAR